MSSTLARACESQFHQDKGSTLTRSVYSSEHDMFRNEFRRFLEQAVLPFHQEWEAKGQVPKEVWQEAGRRGLLCPTVPESYGGAAGDFGFCAVGIEEIARVNATGLGFAMHSDVVAPYIVRYGSEQLKQKWLPLMVTGDAIAALAITEPGTGSDMKAIRTSARREGEEYVINGSKTFITNGTNCGFVVLAVKTAPDLGRKGVSLILVPEGAKGFRKGRKLQKIGLLAQDTAELFFEDVRVPTDHLLGDENAGYSYLTQELAQERLVIALRAAASIEAVIEETVGYVKERAAFGKKLFEFQNTKFQLSDARAQSEMLRCFVDDCLAAHLRGELSPERAAMVKLMGAEMQGKILDSLLQLHGGYGFMSEYLVGRAWRDARVMRIYGGSSEMMREIISRSL